MKMVGWVVCMALCIPKISWSYTSGIAIASEEKTSLHVFVNGKSFTKKPVHFVRI